MYVEMENLMFIMKILAVIPARAGSKGIPNKNIRIVCGHPLIYYSIKNALDSEYITDVIISTDSPEVRIIATQMGTKYKWRDKSLCGDDVTLDSVVYDAVPKDDRNYERDYCILTLFLNCGMRLAELVGIDLQDIADDRTKLTVTGKGSKMRVIYLNSACRAALDAYRAGRSMADTGDGEAFALFMLDALRAEMKTEKDG